MKNSTTKDIRTAKKAARELMKEFGFLHVVYAYLNKGNPDFVTALESDFPFFETEQEYKLFLDGIEKAGIARGVYAVHLSH